MPAPPADPCAGVPEGMSCVRAGELVRGVDHDTHRCAEGGQPPDGKSAAVPAARILLDTFFIDQTEVTVAAYEDCVKRGACRAAPPFYRDFDAPDQPKTGVSWYDADAFCRAQGKRLPSETEWEKAARGADGAATPFGNGPVDCDTAVIEDARGRSCGVRNSGEPEVGHVLAVRSRPAGRYGLFDMAGNAEEWVADWWSPSWAACGEACTGPNPKGPCGGGAEPCPKHGFKVVRGGSWYWGADHATGYHRRRHFPANEPFHHFGFRCAKSPQGPGTSHAPLG
jgi:formylglycine-generating enzyme